MAKIYEKFGDFIGGQYTEDAVGEGLPFKISQRSLMNLPLAAFIEIVENEYFKVLQDMADLKQRFGKEFPPCVGYSGYTLSMRKQKGRTGGGLHWRKFVNRRLKASLDHPEDYARSLSRSEAESAGFQKTIPVDMSEDRYGSMKHQSRPKRKKGFYQWVGNRLKRLPPQFYSSKNNISEKTREKFQEYDRQVRHLNKKYALLAEMIKKLKHMRISYMRNKVFRDED